LIFFFCCFFFQAEDGIRDYKVTGVQTCALPICIAEIPAGEDPDSLIQREGKEAFEKRIAEAPEFFDYWIARSAEQTDLTSITARSEERRVGKECRYRWAPEH